MENSGFNNKIHIDFTGDLLAQSGIDSVFNKSNAMDLSGAESGLKKSISKNSVAL